jgi:hypothetical protein
MMSQELKHPESISAAPRLPLALHVTVCTLAVKTASEKSCATRESERLSSRGSDRRQEVTEGHDSFLRRDIKLSASLGSPGCSTIL